MRRTDKPEHPGASLRGPTRPFDAFDLVTQRGVVRGGIDAPDLPRIADALADDGGHVSYAITGTTDEADRPALDVAIDGELFLTCQRCLGPMRWVAAQRIKLLLAHDARELAQLDDSDEREVVLADAPLDAVELVEDELLLTMPYAPRHPPDEQDQCTPAHGDTFERESPFGALAGFQPRGDAAKRTKR